MQYQTNHRKSIRLQGYDYRNSGAYFITICTKSPDFPLADNRAFQTNGVFFQTDMNKAFFQTIRDNDCKNVGGMHLTPVGQDICEIIQTIPEHSEGVLVDEWVIMPDHIHLILQMNNIKTDNWKLRIEGNHFSAISPRRRTLGVVVRQFKAAVTGKLRKSGNFAFKWQRNYYEHIIRNEQELLRIRTYIQQNPQKLLEAQICRANKEKQ